MAPLRKFFGARTEPPPAAAAPPRAEPDQGAIIGATKERRRKSARIFSVLTLTPQLIPGERIYRAELDVVARTLEEQLRDGDSYCEGADGAFFAKLVGTTDDQAEVVAHRIARDLWTRSAAVKRRNWHVAVAAYPRDAATEAALARLARTAALRKPATRR
jgi:hypothetical protein